MTQCTADDHPSATELRELRSRWELASVFDFLDLFGKQLTWWSQKENGHPPDLGVTAGVTAGELEDALINPATRENARLLTRLHVGLLKGLFWSAKQKKGGRKSKAVEELAAGRWAPVLAAKVGRGSIWFFFFFSTRLNPFSR